MKRLLKPVPLAAIAATVALVALLAYAVAQNGPNRSIDDAIASGQRPAAPPLDLPRLDGASRLSLAADEGGSALACSPPAYFYAEADSATLPRCPCLN